MGALVSLAVIPHSINQLADLAVGSLPSPSSRRAYTAHIRSFLASGSVLSREGVQSHLQRLRATGAGPSTLALSLAAIRLLAREANIRDQLPDATMSAIERIKGDKRKGERVGNWLDLEQVKLLLRVAENRGSRDAAILAVMLGCGLRRAEVAALTWQHWQDRAGRRCIVDIVGKGQRIRTVPCPPWAASYIEEWRSECDNKPHCGILTQSIFGLSAQGIFYVVRDCARLAGFPDFRPHDARRTMARLTRAGGGSIEQISHLLGHASIQTTERYIGSQLELRAGLAAVDLICPDDLYLRSHGQKTVSHGRPNAAPSTRT